VAIAAPAAEAPKPEEETAPPEAAPKGGKRRLILIAAPVVLASVLAGLWFSGIAPRLLGMNHA